MDTFPARTSRSVTDLIAEASDRQTTRSLAEVASSTGVTLRLLTTGDAAAGDIWEGVDAVGDDPNRSRGPAGDALINPRGFVLQRSESRIDRCAREERVSDQRSRPVVPRHVASSLRSRHRPTRGVRSA
jgi:hypothetical protein